MATPASGKSRLLLLGIIALVVIVAAGGATTWFVLHKSNNQSDAGQTTTTTATHDKKVTFYELEPFTVNLKGGSYGDRLLYVHITLQLGDKATEEYLQKHLPQVRNRLLMVFSDQDATELITSDGKVKLSRLIRNALNKPFTGTQPHLKVNDVLFTQFIVQ